MGILMFFYLLLLTVIAVLSLVMSISNRGDVVQEKEERLSLVHEMDTLKAGTVEGLTELYLHTIMKKSVPLRSSKSFSIHSSPTNEFEVAKSIEVLRTKLHHQRLALGLQPFSLIRSLDINNTLFKDKIFMEKQMDDNDMDEMEKEAYEKEMDEMENEKEKEKEKDETEKNSTKKNSLYKLIKDYIDKDV
jgi:hypothetical protein